MQCAIRRAGATSDAPALNTTPGIWGAEPAPAARALTLAVVIAPERPAGGSTDPFCSGLLGEIGYVPPSTATIRFTPTRARPARPERSFLAAAA
ncbi:MAG: hypothetical protein IPK16_33240 [Anaerolineales bacterium]|nr:hypothetical protein [Anaerolineales bacterium]